jgi:hypothetical protein
LIAELDLSLNQEGDKQAKGRVLQALKKQAFRNGADGAN